ncbi:hypothetical protein EXIGLDRAFT_570689, partial [Exidia glandulosa HHB12029]
VDINLMHRRLGHLHFDAVRRMVNDGCVQGVIRLSGKPDICEHCIMGKMRKLSF